MYMMESPNILLSELSDLMNHMLPNIPEFVLREWLPQELNCTELKINAKIDTLIPTNNSRSEFDELRIKLPETK